MIDQYIIQFADQYGIDLIPTHAFQDQNGREYFRHEGFSPEEELRNM